MKLLKFLFILSVLTLPLGELLRYQSKSGIGITANDLTVGILVIYWLIYHVLNKKGISHSFLAKPLLLFVGIAFFSLIINTRFLLLGNSVIAFLYIFRWVFYAAIFFVIKDFDSNFRKKIPILILCSAGLIAFGGYIQFFLYPNLRNLYYLGWDEHLYRMFSSFLDPNFLGEFLVLNFILAFGYAINYLKAESTKIFLFAPLTLFLLIGIVLTYSRSALLMLFLSVIVFFLVYDLAKKYIFGFFILLFIFILISPRAFKSEGTNFFREYSSMERIVSMENALYIFKQNPVIGAGFDAYRYAQIRYGFRKQKEPFLSHADAGTDNSFLFVLATTGIVGLIVYLFMWFKILKYHYLKIYKKNRNPKLTSVIFISSALGLAVGSLFINSLFYPFIMEWIWIMASV